eukprot:5946411-Prorocentrum_lima.AAC.1
MGKEYGVPPNECGPVNCSWLSLESTDLSVLPNARLVRPWPSLSSCPAVICALRCPMALPNNP